MNLLLGRATGKAEYFDKAERILWGPFFHHLRPNGGLGNDIVAPADGLLQTVGYEAAGCCTMGAPNGLVRALSCAVLADQDGLMVPLYYPFVATAQSSASGEVRIAMQTSYPDGGLVRIAIQSCQSTQPWRLKLRVPAWGSFASVKVNGEELPIKAQNGWIELRRIWAGGDEITFDLPMNLWLSRPNSDAVLEIPEGDSDIVMRKIRVFRGPMLLGVDKQRNPDLNWGGSGRLKLMVPVQGQKLGALLESPSLQGMDPQLSYPRAHLKAHAGYKSSAGLKPEQIKGAQQITLRVLNGGDGNGCDHAAWGFARFIEEGAPDPLGGFAPERDTMAFSDAVIPSEQLREAVLTPVAEFPGKTAPTPKETEALVVNSREAVLFDVILTRKK